MLHDAAHAPPSEQLPRLVAHVKKYHYPDLSEAKIAEVLSRGGNRYWRVGDHSECEQECLLGWMIDILMHWESRDFDVAKDRQDAARLAGNGEVEATLSWIEAADRLAREHKVPLQVSWRRSARWTRICRILEAVAARLWLELSLQRVADPPGRSTRKDEHPLRRSPDDLNGIPGTYRKLDGHWSRKGEAMVADRVKKGTWRPIASLKRE
jgi:hypothetical protein